MQFLLFILVALLVSALTAQLRRVQSKLGRYLGFSGAIAPSLREGVLAVDAEGIVTFANPAAGKLLASSLDTMVPRFQWPTRCRRSPAFMAAPERLLRSVI